MKKRLVAWLKKLSRPDVSGLTASLMRRLVTGEVRPALAEDLRKIGVAALGIGLVGVIVNGVPVPRIDAFFVLLFGAIIWVTGLWLTSMEPADRE